MEAAIIAEEEGVMEAVIIVEGEAMEVVTIAEEEAMEAVMIKCRRCSKNFESIVVFFCFDKAKV